MGNWFTRRSAVFGLVALGLMSLAVVACTATGKAKGEGTFGVPGGKITVAADVDFGGGRYSANNTSRRCFSLKFYDGQGKLVGEDTIEPGGKSGSIPAGAVVWVATEIPCPPKPNSPGGSGGGSGGRSEDFASDETALAAASALPTATPMNEFVIAGAPLYIDRSSPTGNAAYSFTVRCASGDEALRVVLDALDDPIGSAIDSRITVHSYLKVRENTTSASVIGIARQPFTRFDLDVNGHADYATLASGATQAVSPSGLYVVDAPVALLDIHGYGKWNHLTVVSQNGGGAAPHSTEASMLHEQ